MYTGCPVLWSSKLQTEITLSTAESEYVALSQSTRQVLPFMSLLKEINKFFELYLPKPKIFCKIYEDNNACIALAQNQKFSPRTKHIALKYHHFRNHVKNGDIQIERVDTQDQLADIFTKPLFSIIFKKLRKLLLG